MISLADLNQPADTPKLQDFTKALPVGNALNKATVSNLASHAAILSSPDSVVNNYTAIQNELTNSPSSPTLDRILKQTESVDRDLMYQEVQKMLASPSISSEEKYQAVDGYMNFVNEDNNRRSLSSVVAAQAAGTPSSPDENDETVETVLFDSGRLLDEVDAYRGWAQNEINIRTALKDRDGFNLFLDFVETMVPFMEPAAVAKTRLAQGGGAPELFQSIALLGESKNDVRKAIAAMPFDQRKQVASQLIEIVKSTGGSWTLRPNELNVVNQLNDYLINGQYNGEARFLDNVFSLIDVVIPSSGIIGKLFKGAKMGAQAAATAARAEAAEARLAANVEDVIVNNVTETVPVNTETVTGLQNIVLDKVFENFDEVPFGKLEDLRTQIQSVVVESALTNPKQLAKDVVEVARKFNQSNNLTQPTNKQVASMVRYITEQSNIARLSTVHNINHTSVSQTLKDVNPGKARAVNNLMEQDPTDKVAIATHGSSRSEAIVNDRGPEVANADGSVRNKVAMDEAGPKPSQGVIDAYLSNKGRIDLDQKEKLLMREKAKNDWRNVNGLVARESMSTIGDLPSGVSFDVVYGPTDGGFSSARQGLEQVLFALRKYGVDAGEVEILSRDATGKYIPITGVPSDKGNYLIRAKHNYEFSVGDTVEYSMLPNSKLALFDTRVSLTDGTSGSVLEHAIPASSIVNKVVFNSASAASDKTAWINKKLLELASVYAKNYKKLSKRQKALVDLYRVEANDLGLEFSIANLKAKGFDDDAIETMRSWKTTTDTMWYLENVDMNKTLRARGYERFIDQVSRTDLIVKSLAKNNLSGITKVYDPVMDEFISLTKDEVDKIYEAGGNIAQTKTPLSVRDEAIEHIVVRQKSDSSYTRRIRDEDNTLSYRHGYYPVKYDAPIFITKEFVGEGGKKYKKAIATAGSQIDATRLLERLRTTEPDSVFSARGDYRRGSSEWDEAEWSVAVSGGRSSQRLRGQLLEDGSKITDLDHKHVMSPEESLIQSIRSIASRTAFRDWIETTKSRWLSQNGDLLEKVDGYKTMWPSDVRDIGRNNLEVESVRLKDAKATWRYVHAMEAGYVNLLDDMTKNFFKNMSIDTGKKGWGWLEKGASSVAEGSVSNFARRKAFRLLLAANPLRQLPVQAMQSLPILLATNPLAIPKITSQMMMLDYLANGGDATSFMKALTKGLTGMNEKEAAQLAKHWEASGFEASVDAHTLIRDQLGNIVDRTWWDKTKAVTAKPLDFTQKYGFNLGEKILMRSIWLSEYDLLRKTGKKIDAEALDNLNAKVRNLTLNMNKAGELPYNQNTLSVFAQFFQAPHKAIGQVFLGHQGLTRSERLRLGASYILTYGIGGGYVTDAIMKQIGTTDPETRELIEGGVFNILFNSALSMVFGKEVRTDFSDSLRLLEAPNPFEFWNALTGSELSEVLTSSPSASLVFGSDPRLTNFVRQMFRPFIVDDSQKPEELAVLGRNFAELFSGASNFFKAKYALEFQKSITSKGTVVDYHINDIEAIMKMFGFNTIDEIQQYASNDTLYRASNKFKEDIKKVVDEVSARLADTSLSNEEAGWWFKMMAEAQRVFKNDPVYMEEFMNQIKYKAEAGEFSIYERLRNMSGYMTPEEFEKAVDGTNLPEDARKTLKDMKKVFGAI